MKIKKFEIFMDGGTVKISTDEGIFCFDHRLKTKTDDRIYNDIPKKDNSNIIENTERLEIEIVEALKNHRDEFYQSSIEHFIKTRQK